MKYCDHCKFFKTDFRGKKFGTCRNEYAALYDEALISKRYAPYAATERIIGNCGMEGKLYESKPK
jgi:hypothetical protein